LRKIINWIVLKVRILIGTHVFAPSIGGIETCSLDLALSFSKLGHEVRVLTQTLSSDSVNDHGLKVIRRPTKADLFRAVRWCEVFFQNNISLQTVWPSWLLRKPLVITHATWLEQNGERPRLIHYLKRMVIHRAKSIAISQAIATHVGGKNTIISNPYDSETFREWSGLERARDFVFVGRLVSDKGVDLLLEAMGMLKRQGFTPSLSIVGSGPEREKLQTLALRLGLQDQVVFCGAMQGTKLAKCLNTHRCMVIPSRWAEPFGIVALEGIACGCVAIGSRDGGLAEAIGPCGVTFPNGDATALAGAMEDLLTKPAMRESLLSKRKEHLEPFTARNVARRYLEIFEEMVN
jgi:glycosyltransferase involved in cell wall biosynthesis